MQSLTQGILQLRKVYTGEGVDVRGRESLRPPTELPLFAEMPRLET